MSTNQVSNFGSSIQSYSDGNITVIVNNKDLSKDAQGHATLTAGDSIDIVWARNALSEHLVMGQDGKFHGKAVIGDPHLEDLTAEGAQAQALVAVTNALTASEKDGTFDATALQNVANAFTATKSDGVMAAAAGGQLTAKYNGDVQSNFSLLWDKETGGGEMDVRVTKGKDVDQTKKNVAVATAVNFVMKDSSGVDRTITVDNTFQTDVGSDWAKFGTQAASTVADTTGKVGQQAIRAQDERAVAIAVRTDEDALQIKAAKIKFEPGSGMRTLVDINGNLDLHDTKLDLGYFQARMGTSSANPIYASGLRLLCDECDDDKSDDKQQVKPPVKAAAAAI